MHGKRAFAGLLWATSSLTLLGGCATVTSAPVGQITNASVEKPARIAPGLTYYLPRQLVRLTVVKTDPKATDLLAAQNKAMAAAAAATAARAGIEDEIAGIKASIVKVADNAVVRDMLIADLRKLETALVAAKTKESVAKTDLAKASDAMTTHHSTPQPGTGTNSTVTIELLPMSPDPDFAFRLDPRHSVLRDDTHKIELSPNGLLTSADIVADDRTDDIIAELAVIAGYGLGGLTRAVRVNQCKGAPKRIVAILDLADDAAVNTFNDDVVCLGVRIEKVKKAGQPGVASSTLVAASDGLYYRSAVDAHVRVSYCGLDECPDNQTGWFLRDTLTVSLPQLGAIARVKQDAGLMTRTHYRTMFKDGVLVSYDADRPSEALAGPRAIVAGIDGIFSGFSKVISLRTGQNADRAGLSASDLATAQALGRDAEKMRLYNLCTTEKRATQESLLPCFDLLD